MSSCPVTIARALPSSPTVVCRLAGGQHCVQTGRQLRPALPGRRPAPPVFTKTSHGRRCRRGHHGTDRPTHVLPRAEQRRHGPLRDPEPLITNELEVSARSPGLPTRSDQQERTIRGSGGSHLRCNARCNSGRTCVNNRGAPTRCNPPRAGSRSRPPPTSTSPAPPVRVRDDDADDRQEHGQEDALREHPGPQGRTLEGWDAPGCARCAVPAFPGPDRPGGGTAPVPCRAQAWRDRQTSGRIITVGVLTAEAEIRGDIEALERLLCPVCWQQSCPAGAAGGRPLLLRHLPHPRLAPPPPSTRTTGEGTGHRDVDPSPGRAPSFPVTGRRHNVLLTRFLTPAGHNPAGKPPGRWVSPPPKRAYPPGTGP